MGLSCSKTVTVKEVQPQLTNTSDSSSIIETPVIKEEIMFQNNGSNNYMLDIEYINNKIDEYCKQNTLIVYSDTQYSKIIINQNELKTSINNFINNIHKQYISPELSIRFNSSVDDNLLVITPTITINLKLFANTYWKLFVVDLIKLINVNEDIYSYLTYSVINNNFNHKFNDIDINIVLRLHYSFNNYSGDGIFSKIFLSWNYYQVLGYNIKQPIIESLFKSDKENNGFVNPMLNVYYYSKKRGDSKIDVIINNCYHKLNMDYLFKSYYLKDIVIHDNITYDTKGIYDLTKMDLYSLNNHVIPYCIKPNNTYCKNIVLYGNKIIQKILSQFYNAVGNNIEVNINEINITKDAMVYVHNILMKYDFNFTISKLTLKNDNNQYKITIKLNGVLPRESRSQTEQPVLSIPVNMDLTTDYSLTSRDSVNSTTNLLIGFKSSPAIVSDTLSTANTVSNRNIG